MRTWPLIFLANFNQPLRLNVLESMPMATVHSIQGLIAWVGRDEWRDKFEDVFDRHVGAACRGARVDFDDLADIVAPRRHPAHRPELTGKRPGRVGCRNGEGPGSGTAVAGARRFHRRRQSARLVKRNETAPPSVSH